MKYIALILLLIGTCLSCTNDSRNTASYFCKANVINFDGDDAIKYFHVDQHQFHISDSCAIDSVFYEYVIFGNDTAQHSYFYLFPEFSRAHVYRFDSEDGSLNSDTLKFLELPRSVDNGRIRHEIYNGFKKDWPKKFSFRYWIWYDSTKSNSKIDTLRNDYHFKKAYVDSGYIFGFRPCKSSRINVDN